MKLVEIDVALTSDNVAVLFHDDTVERTTDGTGAVADMTWDQLRTLNAAAKFHDQSVRLEFFSNGTFFNIFILLHCTCGQGESMKRAELNESIGLGET